ncbi:MAG: ABC transporter ATP-binding protein [Cystobacter sp.]
MAVSRRAVPMWYTGCMGEQPVGLSGDEKLELTVEGVSKSYRRGKRVLSEVNLHIRAGDTFGIIGPNGAGKTTLFGCMLGLIWPDEGRVRVSGLPPDDLSVRRAVGYLPERLSFDAELTPRALLTLHHELALCPRAGHAASLEALLARVGLARAVWDSTTRRFSRGMLQRLGLAHPGLLLVPAPTAAPGRAHPHAPLEFGVHLPRRPGGCVLQRPGAGLPVLWHGRRPGGLRREAARLRRHRAVGRAVLPGGVRAARPGQGQSPPADVLPA